MAIGSLSMTPSFSESASISRPEPVVRETPAAPPASVERSQVSPEALAPESSVGAGFLGALGDNFGAPQPAAARAEGGPAADGDDAATVVNNLRTMVGDGLKLARSGNALNAGNSAVNLNPAVEAVLPDAPAPLAQAAPALPERPTPFTDDMRMMLEDIQNNRPAPAPRASVPEAPPALAASPESPVTAAGPGRLARGLNGGFGLAGAGFSGYTASQGLRELSRGELVTGSLDTLGGGAGVVSGLTSLGAAASPLLARASGVGAGVSLLADGARDVYTGYQAGDGERAALGGVKGVAGGLLTAAPFSGPAGPALALGGAALYTGALVYENREEIGNFIGGAFRGNGAPAPDTTFLGAP